MKRKSKIRKKWLDKKFKNIPVFTWRYYFLLLCCIFMKIGIYLVICGAFLSVFSLEFMYANASLQIDCDVIPKMANDNNLTEENLKALGVGGYYDQNTQNLTVFIPVEDENYMKAVNHEKCHLKQANEGRMFNCNFRFGVFLNELECYIKTGVPT